MVNKIKNCVLNVAILKHIYITENRVGVTDTIKTNTQL